MSFPFYDESLIRPAAAAINALYAEAGREPDAIEGQVWVARIMYDYCDEMPWALAQAKHLRVLRRELGLPASESIPSRLQGELRIVGGGFQDGTGFVLPILAHAGDLLSRVMRGHTTAVERELDDLASAEFDGVRTWTVLYAPGPSSYWAGRDVGPWQTDYWESVRWFVAALKARGLRWLVCPGGWDHEYSMAARKAYMRRLAEEIGDVTFVAGLEGVNEGLGTGEGDPGRLREIVDAFRAVLPVDVWSLTSPSGETKEELDRYSGTVYNVHGERGGSAVDKIRHIFSIPYEQKPRKRLGAQTEPFGWGRNVSVTENMDDLDDEAMNFACVQSLASRQMWVWFSSPGVISDGWVERLPQGGFRPHFDAGEHFRDFPGFHCAQVARAILPRDVMSWPTLCHGGTGQPRIYAVPTNGGDTRADHTIADDGRFVARLYGAHWRDCGRVKPVHIDKQRDFGPHGRVVLGQS